MSRPKLLELSVFRSLLLLAVFTSSASAEDWPQFRGPTGDGHASDRDLPIRWDEQTHVAWKTPIPGKGHSSPVVWGKQLWLTTAHGGKRPGDALHLDAICIDTKTGRVIQQHRVFENVKAQNAHKMSSQASPTPVIEENRIYLHFGSYGTACLDTVSGKTLWTRRDLIIDHRHGPGSSPVLVNDLLVLQFDGMDRQFVIALDKKTGKTVWRRRRDIQYNSDNGERKKAYCTPLLIQHEGKAQLVTTAARSAIAYDPTSGDTLWRVRFIGDSATARPVLGGGVIYLTTSCKDAKMLAIHPGGRGDITETGVAWKLLKGVPQRPSPLYINGLLYGIHDNGVMTCRDPKTGDAIWQKRLGDNYAASPVYAAGRIYVISESGKTSVIAPGRKYQLLATNQLDTGCVASPAVADGAIFLRTSSHLYRIRKPADRR
jgi:outer membrane protein assembly factor BamB